jgi:hypothetical protein
VVRRPGLRPRDNPALRIAVGVSAGLVVFVTVFRRVGRADVGRGGDEAYNVTPSTVSSTRSL